MADLTPKRWFLPEEPDVLGLLSDQLEVTIEGVEAFARWADGGAPTGSDLRESETTRRLFSVVWAILG